MKRSVTLSGHRTSISLEEPFWAALKAIAEQQARKPVDVIVEIDATRLPDDNLSSAIRIYILNFFKTQAEATHSQS